VRLFSCHSSGCRCAEASIPPPVFIVRARSTLAALDEEGIPHSGIRLDGSAQTW
jgi:hypothetical protein